ncbi:hypothetical protein PIL02S_03369 [Paenibacillus illinoisensis]|uniref:Uncharacterized protein n=1 Tax=Paenibacillus illinoisensis TaxID=59845 RepID=A0A2W0C681_9BACL|nr:hypothetical protein PIL02S_03369 [Paenibacillus illinoisensis]
MVWFLSLLFVISAIVLDRVLRLNKDNNIMRGIVVGLMFPLFLCPLFVIYEWSPWKEGVGLAYTYLVFYLLLILYFANVKPKQD